MNYPVPLLAKQMVAEWDGELAEQLQRPREEIVSDGLLPSDFPSDTKLRITLMDGSFVVFRYAFSIRSEERKALAVFTEHCGHHLFPSHESRVEIIHGDP